MIRFDSYFSNGLKLPTSKEFMNSITPFFPLSKTGMVTGCSLKTKVNRSGFIFITHTPNTRYEAADKAGSGTWRMEQGLGVETLPMVDSRN